MAERGKRRTSALTSDDLKGQTTDSVAGVSSDEGVSLAGYLVDFISGTTIPATPEEVETTQPFSRRLVSQLGYPKELIQTRPQHRVRPSSSAVKSEPVDIAVFLTEKKTDDDLFIVIECKRRDVLPTEDNGLAQIRTYLRNSAALFGVWTNGIDTIVYRKSFEGTGNRRRPVFRRVSSVPRFIENLLESIDDDGLKDNLLVPGPDFRKLFTQLRNYLAGNAVGMTRDDDLVDEVINLLLCKLYDERYNGTEKQPLQFRVLGDESPEALKNRLNALLEKARKKLGAIADSDQIRLDPQSLHSFVERLAPYRVFRADRDVIGDAFEAFIGPSLRGNEGQFFTPRNVIDLAVRLSDVDEDTRIIDPACGSGGFLVAALEKVWRQLELDAEDRGWNDDELGKERDRVASNNFCGADKDRFLAKTTKAYMALMGDGKSRVYCTNSLLPFADQSDRPEGVGEGAFDAVLSNPPYGRHIPVEGLWVADYELGCRPGAEHSELPSQRPEILFIERCVKLVKPGGVVALVLPEGLFAGKTYGYILDWILAEVRPTAIVTLPHETFKTSGKGGTRTRTLLFVGRRKGGGVSKDPFPDQVFMAEPTTCGWDSRAHEIDSDEIRLVAQRYAELVLAEREGIPPVSSPGRLGTLVPLHSLRKGVLLPRFYLSNAVSGNSTGFEYHTVRSLVEAGAITISRPSSPPAASYDDAGEVPFVRTSDITDRQVASNPKKRVSRAVFERLGERSQAVAGDILFIKDGEELIGRVAYVMPSDGDLLLQSHILRLRVDDASARHLGLNRHLIFAALASPEVQAQIPRIRFTQSTIATVGDRFYDLVLAFPTSLETRKMRTNATKRILRSLDTVKQEWRDLLAPEAN